MQTQTAGNLKSKSEPRPEESTAAVKLKPLRDGVKELEEAYLLMRASASALKEKVKAVAEKSGLEPSVVRAFIAARCAEDSDRAEARAERARQLALVFDEVGT